MKCTLQASPQTWEIGVFNSYVRDEIIEPDKVNGHVQCQPGACDRAGNEAHVWLCSCCSAQYETFKPGTIWCVKYNISSSSALHNQFKKCRIIWNNVF